MPQPSLALRLPPLSADGGSRIEYRLGFAALALLFALILLLPLGTVFVQAFLKNGAVSLENWSLLARPGFWRMMGNSFLVSGLAAAASALIAFFAAYGLTFTNIPSRIKRLMHVVLLLPLFLPSITYGFAVIYSFGRMGLLSQIFGQLPFSIYGFWGLFITDVIYTLPPAFLVLYNAFRFVDRRYAIVSRLMGDGLLRGFWQTALRPTLGALVCAFVLAFFLAFTDFGIPVSIAGEYEVIATTLYSAMMGAVPDFGAGAVIAISMLVPSAAAVLLLKRTERLNFRYGQLSETPPLKHRLRDSAFLVFFGLIALVLLAVFAVIFIVPFVEHWPYKPVFTLVHVKEALGDPSVWTLYLRSVGVALLSAAVGTVTAFAAAMIRARSTLAPWCKTAMDWVAILTSTLPGMVLGIGYLFAFSGTPLQNTLAVLVLANLAHFLATPYLMATTALSKMNDRWETTGQLMGDSWLQSVRRVLLPNAQPTLVQMFETYFINAMVTISAIVFLTGTRTMVLTTRIKELQFYERFDAIFVLSLLIFATNVAAKLVFDRLSERRG